MRKLILFVFMLSAMSSIACTSVLISGRRTASGKPIIFKNRDTGCLDNRLQWWEVNGVRFVGIVNSPVADGEIWSGTNSYGFSILNTADYNFNEDSLYADYQKRILALERQGQDASAIREELRQFSDGWLKDPRKIQMARAGEVMYKALAVCRTVEDFLHLLDTLPKPLGVETNFGVCDAEGGCMYVECNNWRYVTYDVNALPEGYKVQTNYAFAGNTADRLGVERYKTASAIMAEQQAKYPTGDLHIDNAWLLKHFSRSFRHETLGTPECYCPKSGVCVDQDFIPRRITSCTFYAEGRDVWTLLGYPCCGVSFPIVVADRDILPAESKRTADNENSAFSDTNMKIKMQYLFPEKISNGKYYLHIGWIQKGDKQHPAMNKLCTEAEKQIRERWYPIFRAWQTGQLSDHEFYVQYQEISKSFYPIYLNAFKAYL